jgi:hypothetical protein
MVDVLSAFWAWAHAVARRARADASCCFCLPAKRGTLIARNGRASIERFVTARVVVNVVPF